jgi:hypothetical protein
MVVLLITGLMPTQILAVVAVAVVAHNGLLAQVQMETITTALVEPVDLELSLSVI